MSGNCWSGQQRIRGHTLPDTEQTLSQSSDDGLAAQGVANRHSALGAYDRRMRARRGAPKAMTATAHTLARLVYSMVRYGTAYMDAGQQVYEQTYRDRVLTHLQRKAKALGSQLVHVEDLDGGVASML